MEVATRLLIPQQLVRDYVVADTELGQRLQSHADYHDRYGNDYRVRTNGAGFRMDEEVDRREARQRVLVYGDSFTFGFGVDYEYGYFALLKRVLEREKPTLQLLNGAIPGFSSGHVKIQMTRDIPKIRPVALVYFFNHNDVFDNAVTDIDYRVTEYRIAEDGKVTLMDRPPYAWWKRFLLGYTPYGWLNRNSHLFVGAKGALKTLIGWKQSVEGVGLAPASSSGGRQADVPGDANAPGYTVTEGQKKMALRRSQDLIAISLAHLERIRVLAAVHNLPLVIVWVPAWEKIFRRDRDLPLVQLMGSLRARMSAMLNDRTPDRRVAFVDTVQMLPPTAMLRPREKESHFLSSTSETGFTGDGHFNQAGNRWFAGLVAPRLSEELAGMLPRP